MDFYFVWTFKFRMSSLSLSLSLSLEKINYLFILSIIHHLIHCSGDQLKTIKLVKTVTFLIVITKTRLFKYIENFTSKNIKFSDKKSDIFHVSARNIDCGYSLVPTIYVFEQK